MNSSIFLFELKKIYKQQRLLLLLLTIFLLCLFFFSDNLSNEQLKLEEVETEITDHLTSVGIFYKMSLANNDDIQVQEHLEEMLQQASEMKLAFNQENWENLNQLKLDYLNSILVFESFGEKYRSYYSLIDYEKEIKTLEYLIENKIDLDSLTHPTSSSLLLIKVSNFMFSPVGLIVLLGLFSSIFLNEITNHTIYFLRTQPLKFRRLLVSKFLVVLTISIAYIFITLLFTYLFSKINGMSSNWDYPVYFLLDHTIVFTKASHYLILLIGQFILQIILIFSFSFVLKLFTRNELLHFIYTALVSAVGIVLTVNTENLQTVFNPFTIFLSLETIYPYYFYLVVVIILISILLLTAVSFFYRRLLIIPTTIEKTINVKKHRILEPFLHFEWLKIKSYRIFTLIMITFIILVSIFYTYLYITANQKEINYIETELSTNTEEFLIHSLEANTLSSTNDKKTEQDLAYLQTSIQLKKEAVKNYREHNYKPLLEYQLRRVNYTLNDGINFIWDNSLSNYGILSVDASIREKEYMLGNDIEPYFPGEFIPTIFQNWETQHVEYEKNFNNNNRKINDSGLYSLYLFLSNNGYLIIIGILYFLLANTIIKDKNSYIHTQPLTFSKVYWGKLLMNNLVTTFTFLGISIYLLLVGTIMNNFGQWKYPILKYDSEIRSIKEGYDGYITLEGAYQFITLGSYLVQCIILILLCIVFMYALSHFFSLFINNSLFLFFTISMLLVGGYFVSINFLPTTSHLLPFIYLEVPKIINGHWEILFNNNSITFMTGCFVLLMSSTVLLLISKIYLSRFEN